MVHSKVAMFRSEQAVRTMLTACVSSDVSITMMGVEELMSTFRRSSPSVIFLVPNGGAGQPTEGSRSSIPRSGFAAQEILRYA